MRTFTEKERQVIDSLADKDYSDMTGEEIELLIDWKAELKARDEQFAQTLAESQAAHEKQLAELEKQTQICIDTQAELLAQSEKALAASQSGA